jgi:pimeloyl-ACP methyl ester carboxylesterase
MTSNGAGHVSSNSVRAREFEALGLRSRVLEAGASDGAEAVVMMHGGPGAADDWALLLPEVGKFARAVAFDLPGFGKADKPRHWWGYSAPGWATFFAAALSELGIEHAHLVVNDLAGGPALNWAAAHPDALRSATLINTGDLIDFRWHAIGKLHRTPLLGPLAAITGRMGMGPVMRLYEPRLPKEVVRGWRRDYDWGTRRSVLRFYHSAPAAGMGGLALRSGVSTGRRSSSGARTTASSRSNRPSASARASRARRWSCSTTAVTTHTSTAPTVSRRWCSRSSNGN